MGKKIVVIFLSMMIVLSVVLVGCGKTTDKEDGNKPVNSSKSNDKKTTEKKEETSALKVNPAGKLPIVNDKIDLTILCKDNQYVDNFETNTFTKELEKATNIHIKWQLIPEANLKEKVNIVLASGNYPDVFMDCGISPSQQMNYGKQGVFIPLNDMIEKYGAGIKRVFEQRPYIKDVITLPDGNIYDMPYINECYHCTACNKLFIYKPWLDKLNLDMPETTEDFYKVLKAFKEQDPNGNGSADEIPLAGTEKSWNGSVITFLMNAFIYNDGIDSAGKKNLFVKDGKITAAFDKEEYREGLRFIHKLYKEGLIVAESFTQDGSQLVRMGTQMPNILGAAPGGSRGVFTRDDMEGDKGRGFDFVCLPALEGPKGVRTVTFEPFAVYQGRYLISKQCKYPEVAFRMADLLYTEEWTLKSVEGVEGINWRKAENGEKTLYGKPAKWAHISKDDYKKIGIDENKTKNTSWVQTGPSFRTAEYRANWALTVPFEQMREKCSSNDILGLDTKAAMEPYKPSIDTIVPPLVFDENQSKEIPSLKTAVNNYVKECIARFIIGDLDLDKDWDKYLKELDKIGFKRYLQLYQEAYEANK